jgi:predicted transcriptional regulator
MRTDLAQIDYARIAGRIGLFCDSARLEVLFLLGDGEMQLNDFASRLGYSTTHLATSLAMLKLGGLVELQRRGRRTAYLLTEVGRRVHRELARLVKDE